MIPARPAARGELWHPLVRVYHPLVRLVRRGGGGGGVGQRAVVRRGGHAQHLGDVGEMRGDIGEIYRGYREV